MKLKWDKILKWYLIFGAIYILFDGLIHFFPIRLVDVHNIWPEAAYQYARFFSQLYASYAIFIAGSLFILQTDLKKFRPLIIWSSYFAIFHACLLIWNTLAFNFESIFQSPPSLRAWLPSYNLIELFEAVLLLIYAIIVYTWNKSHD